MPRSLPPGGMYSSVLLSFCVKCAATACSAAHVSGGVHPRSFPTSVGTSRSLSAAVDHVRRWRTGQAAEIPVSRLLAPSSSSDSSRSICADSSSSGQVFPFAAIPLFNDRPAGDSPIKAHPVCRALHDSVLRPHILHPPNARNELTEPSPAATPLPGWPSPVSSPLRRCLCAVAKRAFVLA